MFEVWVWVALLAFHPIAYGVVNGHWAAHQAKF